MLIKQGINIQFSFKLRIIKENSIKLNVIQYGKYAHIQSELFEIVYKNNKIQKN